MGWASGFQAGTSMAKQWLDTYNEAERRRQFEGIQKAKEFEQYTPQQGEQLRGLSEQVDEFGRPRYQFEIDPGSTQYRVREIAYPQARPDIEGYSPTWLGQETGIAPQQGAEVSTYAVPSVGLDTRTVLDAQLPGYTRDTTPVNQGLGFYPSMGTEAASIAPQAYEGLTTSAPEYSPDLRISRPDDSAAYRGLTREMGEAQNFAPGQVNYLGKSYAPGGLTPEVRRAAQLEAYADVIARDNPLEAERLRSMAAQEKRAQAAEARTAELYPLQLEEAQIKLASARLDDKDRKAAEQLSGCMAANPEAPAGEALKQARALGMSAKGLDTAMKSVLGFGEAEVKAAAVDIQKQIKGKTWSELLELHKTSDAFTPGRHFDFEERNGKISLYWADTATGKRESNVPAFSGTPDEVGQYLRTQATDENAVVDYVQNLAKSKATVGKLEAEASKEAAYASFLGRRETGAGAGGGLGAKDINAMANTARALQSQLTDVETRLQEAASMMPEKTPQERQAKDAALQALTAQRNQIANSLMSLNQRVMGAITGTDTGLSTGGGGESGPYRKGQRVPAKGRTLEFQGGDYRDPKNWKDVTGSDKASPAIPAKGISSEKNTNLVPKRERMYAEYQAAVKEKEELLAKAKKMSDPEVYLSSRLPDIEARIRANEKYYQAID